MPLVGIVCDAATGEVKRIIVPDHAWQILYHCGAGERMHVVNGKGLFLPSGLPNLPAVRRRVAR